MRYIIKKIEEFSDDEINDLHSIMCSSIDNYPFEEFIKDFRRKTFVILYLDHGKIVGFSGQTLVDYDADTRVIYTGMTVILPEHWGNSALYRSYAQLFRSVIAGLQGKRLYQVFYALSYQSYGFCPFLYQRFYPCWEPSRHDAESGEIGLWIAQKVFGNDVNKETGIITPTHVAEFITSELTDIVYDKGPRDYIDYFLARNPGFKEGHLMVCAARLSEENLNPMAKRIYRRYHEDERLVDYIKACEVSKN